MNENIKVYRLTHDMVLSGKICFWCGNYACMHNVSVYAIEDQQLREQTSAIEQENIELKTRLSNVELEITELKKMLEKLLEA